MVKSQKRVVAFFDFDGTLAEKDSLWPFLLAVGGYGQCIAGLAFGVAYAFMAPSDQDGRTLIKEKLLEHVLGGRPLESLAPAIARMKSWPRWMDLAVNALKDHHAKGHTVVIATGSLSLYVPEMLREALPYDEIIATEMEVVDGIVTGRMLKGNCVRTCKAERVASYIALNGPFDESWAYGNAPHDLPMMELVKNRVVI